MDLYATSVEYATFTIAANVPLDGEVQVTFLPWKDTPTADTVWHPAEWLGDPATTRDCRLLLAGSAADPVPEGAVVLPAGSHWTWVRLPDNPEVTIRRGGTLNSR